MEAEEVEVVGADSGVDVEVVGEVEEVLKAHVVAEGVVDGVGA